MVESVLAQRMPLPVIQKPQVTTSFSQGNSARQDKACKLIHASAEPADKHNRKCLCEGGCNWPLTTPVHTGH